MHGRLRGTGLMPGKTGVRGWVEEVEILATILEVRGVPVPVGVQGKSLLALAKNPKARHKQEVFAEFPTIKMARTNDWKLVHYVKARYGELYDLKADPHELTNLFDDPKHAAARAEMELLLADWLATTQDPHLAPLRDPEEPVK